MTHKGKKEQWLSYDLVSDPHTHDIEGAKYNRLSLDNDLMVERAVTHILVNSTGYFGDDVYTFQIMQEQFVETTWWWHYKILLVLIGSQSYGL